MITPQLILDIHAEAFIDNFAGGGGASTGIEQAIGRHVDAALNHDSDALAMHRMNHPRTRHYKEDIRTADPVKIAGGRPVGGVWFSPDCKHFSKAKGGKPRSKHIRGLAWAVVNWINKLRPLGNAPRVIYLENVEEFQTWCPLLANGMPNPWRKKWFFLCITGAILRRGYAHVEWAPGDGFVYRRTWGGIERIPDLTFSSRACDHSAPTIRRRLYLIARCDGRPVVWPTPTHAAPEKTKALRRKPWRTMAECIDFNHPCPSIFLTREEGRKVKCNRPLAKSTMARVAKGVDRYVLKAKKPFIVELTHQGNTGVASVDDPVKTITGANRGEKALVAPVIAYAQHGGSSRPANAPVHTIAASPKDQNQLILPVMVRTAHGDQDRNGKKRGRGAHAATEPAPSVLASNDVALAAIHVTKFNTGAVGSSVDAPAPTITANSFIKRCGGAAPLGVVAASVVKLRGDNVGHAVDQPGHTISAQGTHHGLVAAYVAQHNGGEKGHQTYGHPVEKPCSTISSKGSQQQLVGAALIPYYGSERDANTVAEPSRTVTTRDRFGLAEAYGVIPPLTPELEAGARRVAKFLRDHGVEFEGEFATVGEFVIVDIGMRMLKPRELYNAQGFPAAYIIDRGLYEDELNGRLFEVALTGTAQVKMCGNSVSPPMACALVSANNPEMRVEIIAA